MLTRLHRAALAALFSGFAMASVAHAQTTAAAVPAPRLPALASSARIAPLSPLTRAPDSAPDELRAAPPPAAFFGNIEVDATRAQGLSDLIDSERLETQIASLDGPLQYREGALGFYRVGFEAIGNKNDGTVRVTVTIVGQDGDRTILATGESLQRWRNGVLVYQAPKPNARNDQAYDDQKRSNEPQDAPPNLPKPTAYGSSINSRFYQALVCAPNSKRDKDDDKPKRDREDDKPKTNSTRAPDPRPKREPEPERAPKPEPQRAPKPEPERAPEPEPQRAPERAAKPERAPKPEPERAPKPEPQRTPERAAKPESAPETKPASAPKPKPESAAKPESAPKPKSERAPNPAPRPERAPKPEPQPQRGERSRPRPSSAPDPFPPDTLQRPVSPVRPPIVRAPNPNPPVRGGSTAPNPNPPGSQVLTTPDPNPPGSRVSEEPRPRRRRVWNDPYYGRYPYPTTYPYPYPPTYPYPYPAPVPYPTPYPYPDPATVYGDKEGARQAFDYALVQARVEAEAEFNRQLYGENDRESLPRY